MVTTIAHSQAPTPDQLAAFRNLPADQQRAVLDSLGAGDQGVARRDPQLSAQPSSAPEARDVQQDAGPPRIQARTTLLLDVSISAGEGASEDLRRLLNGRRERLLAGNPYVSDEEGRIRLPQLPPINLRGLTDDQAAQRLNADPRLDGLEFTVRLLPVEPVEAAALKPFGYDVFGEVPTTFAPANDIPVPSDYRLGPGDNVSIELFGKKTGRYQLVVNRDGTLVIPEFGPIQVTGLGFDQVRAEIDRRISERTIGVSASVTMGELRSIRIFVVGDANRPGAYTVSGLATITNALFASGGVSEIGSLRAIELKRRGTTVARLDLYDLLLRADTSKDVLLEQGDAILVPPIGNTAAIAGEVRRPAIYEFRGEATVGELVRLAGGLKPQADARRIRLERIERNERAVLDLDITSDAGRSHRLLPGDVLTIPQVVDDTRGVFLEGHVLRPGAYAWKPSMRLTDLLGSLQMLRLSADQRYILIRRESADRRVEALSADAVLAFEQRGSDHDPLLQSRDRIIVFSRDADRGAAVADVLRELRLQARDNQPLPIVRISGRVRAPGEYPLEAGMMVADLLRAGGGLDDAAHSRGAELTRYEVVGGEARKTEVVDVQLASAGSTLALRPYDVLVVKETPDWRDQESITLAGEVRFPGSYPIRSNETLSSVIERAGGLTESAFPAGSVLTRQELREQERQQLEGLTRRLRADLALLALQGSQAPQAVRQRDGSAETLAAGQSLLAQLQAAEPTGRLVIDLKGALSDRGGENDIEIRGGDRLIVPRTKPYVTVMGEVQNATTHVYKQGLSRDDYVQLSGGPTRRADAERIYVVRADGSVLSEESSSWFRRDSGGRLQPGDTVVVPIDAERMRPLPLWTAVTTVIYNLAVAVAAIGSL